MANRGTRRNDAFNVAVVALVIEQNLPISLPTKKLVATRSGATRLSNTVRIVFVKNAAASGGFSNKTGYPIR